MTVTRKNVKIISTVTPAIMLLFSNSLGPPCVPKLTFAPSSGNIALSDSAAIIAPSNWKIIYPIPSATHQFPCPPAEEHHHDMECIASQLNYSFTFSFVKTERKEQLTSLIVKAIHCGFARSPGLARRNKWQKRNSSHMRTTPKLYLYFTTSQCHCYSSTSSGPHIA